MPREAQPPRAQARSKPSSMRSPMKTPYKAMPLNDDRLEKSVRFQSRQALHEIQMNQLKAAASPLKNMRKSTDADGDIPHTPGSPGDIDKENDGEGVSLAVVGGNAVTPMKRAPILANFEEWMKMATDNKINATNSWNFALIDYFHDMSLLKEGNSVNFQKASCTLDGCVKIYTSRVDSVATETGKLLSGLADSRNQKSKANGEEGADGEDEEDDEDGEDGVKKRAKKRATRSSEATLVPSFASLQLKKMELEFSVDPLFKKASADFDEGGAKGLLLNHLTVDGQGRIVFDSSNDAPAPEAKSSTPAPEDEAAPREAREYDSEQHHESPSPENPVTSSPAPLDLSILRQKFFSDISILDNQSICPSLQTYELGGSSSNTDLDIPFLKASAEDWKREHSPPKPESNDQNALGNMGGDDDDDFNGGGFDVLMEDEGVGFGEGGEAWARNAAIDTQPRPFDALNGSHDDQDQYNDDPNAAIGDYNPESGQYGVHLPHPSSKSTETADHANILAYFDAALNNTKTAAWAGPEHWRIRRMKATTGTSSDPNAPPGTARKRKEKEPFALDFLAPLTSTTYAQIHTPAQNNSSISLPRKEWKSKTRNLLPDDKHFHSRQLLQLFLKPRARIGARRSRGGWASGQNNNPDDQPDLNQPHDPAFWARRAHFDAEAALAAEQANGNPSAESGAYDANFFADGAPDAGFDSDDDDAAGAFFDAAERLSPSVDPAMVDGAVEGVNARADGALTGEGAPATGAFGENLVTQARRVRPEYVKYARVAKKVDVRRLKEEMWRNMGVNLPVPPSFDDNNNPSTEDASPAKQEEEQQQQQSPVEAPQIDILPKEGQSLKFTQIMNNLKKAYPPEQLRDISTSFGFICLLHLANEKGLALTGDENSNWGEIDVRRDLNGASGEAELGEV